MRSQNMSKFSATHVDRQLMQELQEDLIGSVHLGLVWSRWRTLFWCTHLLTRPMTPLATPWHQDKRLFKTWLIEDWHDTCRSSARKPCWIIFHPDAGEAKLKPCAVNGSRWRTMGGPMGSMGSFRASNFEECHRVSRQDTTERYVRILQARNGVERSWLMFSGEGCFVKTLWDMLRPRLGTSWKGCWCLFSVLLHSFGVMG